MDLNEKKETLIKLLELFLSDRIPADDLSNFSWDIIEYFSKNSNHTLPPTEKFEREFWFTIWQIQHLCDDDHISDGSAAKELSSALSYLKKDKAMPTEFVGRRP
ncbi:MAG: hypothetical protein HOM25_10315 [Rhodospirillaceae bacterium]|jgi:hypothetical protein|nr:hypothetical protein [Rhodospirillaceae bacterium]MBT5667603.1 hypothetical protein [Rhodospirillaceae bacterium]MBT5811132.1 hypothetical protein [Rhodospirillaceae bacterium]